MSSGSSGAQDWRAVACLAPTGERLLCVGESSSQVRAAYTGAWGEVIRDEDRPTVRAISLQRWAGQFWSGQWEHQMYLAVPTARGGKATPGEGGEGGEGSEGSEGGEVLDEPVEAVVEEVEDEPADADDDPESESNLKKK
jgi:hypothetical protein